MDYPPPQLQPDTPIFLQQQVIKDFAREIESYKILPTSKDLEDIAYKLREAFNDGFQWSDIGLMIKLSNDLLDDLMTLSVEDKETSLKNIFDNLIDVTDTPYFPDYYTDPILKEITSAMISVITSENLSSLFEDDYSPDILDQQAVVEYGNRILSKIEDGFQWSDITIITKYTVSICSNLIGISREERIDLAKSILDYIIDETDFPIISDDFIDPIVKIIGHSCLEQFIR